MQLNGAEILIECLKEQGVDTVFGYPGGAILNAVSYTHLDAIEAAVSQVLKDGYRTGDIMSDGCTKVGTARMGDLICERIR